MDPERANIWGDYKRAQEELSDKMAQLKLSRSTSYYQTTLGGLVLIDRSRTVWGPGRMVIKKVIKTYV